MRILISSIPSLRDGLGTGVVRAILDTDKSIFIAPVERLYPEKVGKSWKDLENVSGLSLKIYQESRSERLTRDRRGYGDLRTSC